VSEPLPPSAPGAGTGDGELSPLRRFVDDAPGWGSGPVSWGGGLIWLLFIVLPIADALGPGHHRLPRGVDVVGAIAVACLYVVIVGMWRHGLGRGGSRPLVLLLLAVLYALAATLTLADQPGWGFLFTYSVAVGVLVLRRDLGLAVVLGTCVAAGLCSAVAGGSGGSVFTICLSTAGIGLLMMVMADLRVRNVQLRQARAELARLAVAEERQRFARDLHDLLGHSLSVIALKAELAGRLLPDRPEEAGREVAGVEAVARAALEEVREAVSGYRDLTLEGELAGARMALTAAGIETTVAREAEAIERPVETVLAWAVREAATNVIRHSRASHCTFRLRAAAEAIELEVRDDGVGDALGAGSLRGGPGHGLAGLAERVRTVGGALEAGAAGDGGYRLRLRIPAGEGAA
jgi:two-component system sensor histidine kinase DesK